MSLETEVHAELIKQFGPAHVAGVQDESLILTVANFVRTKTDQLRQSLQRIAEGAHFIDCPAENDETAPCDCHVGEAKRGLGE